MMRSFLPLMLSTSARIFSVVSNTVLAAAAEHERHMIGERTRHALAAAKARGIKLGNPEQAKINWAKAAARAQRCARTSSAASSLAAHRAAPSRPISTREALRHRMVANGFRCRFVASGIVSGVDRGVQNLGAALALAGQGDTGETARRSEVRWVTGGGRHSRRDGVAPGRKEA